MRSEKIALWRRAFLDSLPVLMGYSSMGLVAGILLAARGQVVLAPLWALLSSALWITGTMSIAGVPKIAERISWETFAIMTLAVNFRYLFYGFTLLGRWRGLSFWRRSYLIMMLTDENYALESACAYREPSRFGTYCTMLSMLNHSYWILGLTGGALSVVCLGHFVDPDTIRRFSRGMEFSMAALFLVIFTDQVKGFWRHG